MKTVSFQELFRFAMVRDVGGDIYWHDEGDDLVLNIIAGVVERNLALFTQLMKK